MTDKAIAKRIKRYRKELGLTQAALAEKTGLSTNTIARVERGVNKPSPDTLECLAKAFGVRASDILDY